MVQVYDPTVGPVSLSRPNMRLLANSVLMISDLDVLFTAMSFISYCEQGNWIIPVVLAVSGLVYGLGCWKATRRLELFQFINLKAKQTKEPILIWRVQTRSLAKTTLFEDEDVVAFLNYDADYFDNADQKAKCENGQKLVSEWKAQFHENNQGNTMTMEHSIPFYRLACFGWMGDLNPMDLAGILNANALYSFTVGTPALLLSFWTIFSAQGSFEEKAVFFIAALIGVISFVISLANILQDFTKKLKELIGKEELLEIRMEKARPLIEKMREEHDHFLDLALAGKKDQLYKNVNSDADSSSTIAKWAEEFENRKKIFSQALYAMYRTEKVTDLLPEIESPIKSKQQSNPVHVGFGLICMWMLSVVLLHGNVGLHGYLVVNAILSDVEVKEERFFFVGIATYAVVCLLKIIPSWMFTFRFFETKPHFLTLTENLSPLLPVATSVMHLAGDFDLSFAFDIAGISIAILEVIVSTYMTAANSKAKHVVEEMFKNRALDFDDRSRTADLA